MAKIQVILLEDVAGQGRKGEIVTVSDGYAHNFLLKGKKGVLATPEELQKIESRKKKEAKKLEEERNKSLELKKILEAKTLNLSVKAGENGGQVVAVGTPKEIMENKNSITGAYLSGRKKIEVPKERRSGNGEFITINKAKKNNLKLGDKIKLKGNPNDADNEKKSDKETEVTIVGIFTGQNKGNTSSHMELYDNIFIADTTTTKTLYNYEDGKEIYQDAIFLVDGKDNVDKVIAEAKKLPINWKLFELVKSNQNFPVLQKSLDSIYGITNGVFIGTVVFSIIILSLILFLWINGRRKEIGVNLALGVSKAKIVGQFILELIIISIPSFIVSYFIGKAVSQSIGNQILSQSIKSVTESVANQTKGLNLGANAEVEGASKMITSLDVSVNLTDMMSVVGIGLAVIVIAICITSIRLIYKKPKELLQNIN